MDFEKDYSIPIELLLLWRLCLMVIRLSNHDLTSPRLSCKKYTDYIGLIPLKRSHEFRIQYSFPSSEGINIAFIMKGEFSNFTNSFSGEARVIFLPPYCVHVIKMSICQNFKTTFKSNLTCIYLSVRAK